MKPRVKISSLVWVLKGYTPCGFIVLTESADTGYTTSSLVG